MQVQLQYPNTLDYSWGWPLANTKGFLMMYSGAKGQVIERRGTGIVIRLHEYRSPTGEIKPDLDIIVNQMFLDTDKITVLEA